MVIDFTTEQEAELSDLARHLGKDPVGLVKDAALGLLYRDEQFRAAVLRGIEQADRGEFIEEEEMEARFQRLIKK